MTELRDPMTGHWVAVRLTQDLGSVGMAGPVRWVIETETGREVVAEGVLDRPGCGPAELAAAVGEALTELSARAERAARADSRVFLVNVGSLYGYWGKGATEEQAKDAAFREGRLRKNARVK